MFRALPEKAIQAFLEKRLSAGIATFVQLIICPLSNLSYYTIERGRPFAGPPHMSSGEMADDLFHLRNAGDSVLHFTGRSLDAMASVETAMVEEGACVLVPAKRAGRLDLSFRAGSEDGDGRPVVAMALADSIAILGSVAASTVGGRTSDV